MFVHSNNPKHFLHLIGSFLARLQRLVVHLARRQLLVLRLTLSPIPHRRLQAALEVLQLHSAHIVLPIIPPSNPNEVLLLGNRVLFHGRLSGHRLFSSFLTWRIGRSASQQRTRSATIKSSIRFYAWPSELPAPQPKPWSSEPKKPGPWTSRKHREIAASLTHGGASSWHGLSGLSGLSRLSSRG